MDEDQVTTAAKVAFLRHPKSYPGSPERVEVIETHMAWVFMAGKFVYKLKKPVRYPYLDFSSLSLREFYCHEEVRLNQRLAPGVYLGVVPLTCNDTELALDGVGKVVDWLVRMKRLPRQRMLDRMLCGGGLEAGHLRSLARLLVDFYRSCQSLELSGESYRHRYRSAIKLNLDGFRNLKSESQRMELQRLCDAQLNFLECRSDWFDGRAAERKIVEAHGDLRPQHVCFHNGKPLVIDCLEFNRDLRILDQADETAYLAMECAWMGCSEAGGQFLQHFERYSGDPIPPPLLSFYMAYRATLRVRLLLTRLPELAPDQWPLWRQRAYRYLDLAKRYARALGS